MLTVLIISPAPTVPGGVSVFAECLKKHLVATQYHSFYVGSNGKGNASRFSLLKRLFLSPFKLMSHLKVHKVDLVHLNPTFDAKSLLRDLMLLFVLRMRGYKKNLFYIHGWDENFYTTVSAYSWARSLVAWALNKASMITVLSEKFRNALIDIGVEPNLIKLTRTMFDENDLASAPPSSFINERPFILFMSRFDREKGGRELLEAFLALASDYPDLDLVMAGDGSDAQDLQARAKSSPFSKHVHFPGYVAGPPKWHYLRACKIFALPTYYRSEAMPIVVLEAMGAAKPILIGPAGALPSVLAPENSGTILKLVTAHTVENALRSLLSDQDYLEKAGQNNRELATRLFEAKIVSSEIEKFYQQVATC